MARKDDKYVYLVQEAYCNLVELEQDKDKLLKLAKGSLKIKRNVTALTSTLKAYQKLYAKTNEEKYSQ
jgi:hypothetical protein